MRTIEQSKKPKPVSNQTPRGEIARPIAPRKTKPAQVTIEEIVIPVTWLIVSVRIPAEVAACLKEREKKYNSIDRWSKDVWNFYSDAAFAILLAPGDGISASQLAEKVKSSVPAMVVRWEDLRGYKHPEMFSFHMKPNAWSQIQTISKITGHSESALVRAALWKRHIDILKFEKEQPNRDRMAALVMKRAEKGAVS